MASDSDNLNRGDTSHPPGAITIQVFSTAAAAETAAALLEANKIECWLHADDCGGMLSALDAAHGVKLLVSPADADEAKALLAATPVVAAGPLPDDSSAPVADSTPPSTQFRPIFPQVVAGIVVGVVLCLLYQWTDNLGTKTYRYDWNKDGVPDEAMVYRGGQLSECSVDRNYDGKFDFWERYDSKGYRIQATADDNFDGKPDVTWSYTNAVLVSSRRDTDFNGKPDVTYRYTNELPSQADWQPNETNIVTVRQFFRHGLLHEEWRDTNWDGAFDVRIQFDAFENPISTNAFRLLSTETSPPH